MDSVKVELSGMLREQVGTDLATVSPKLTVRETVAALGMPIAQNVLALVNGQIVDFDYVLRAGDHLRLIPAISGGN